MNEVWLVWLCCEDLPNDLLCGVATSEGKANEMVSKLEEVFGESMIFEVKQFNTDCIRVDNAEYKF